MTQQEVLDLINNFIVANGNNEITANVLNPILEEMINQPNLLIGILSQLQTSDQSNLVNAINEVYNMFGTISDAGIRLYEGTNNPNTTAPAEYNIADFYIEKDLFNNPVKLWQYNGLIWVSMLTIYDIINDGLTGTDTTWSSEKIQEVIDETFGVGFIPLSGTPEDNPITGDLEFSYPEDGYIYGTLGIRDDVLALVSPTNRGRTSPGELKNESEDATTYSQVIAQEDVILISGHESTKGLVGQNFFDKQNDPNAFLQGGDLTLQALFGNGGSAISPTEPIEILQGDTEEGINAGLTLVDGRITIGAQDEVGSGDQARMEFWSDHIEISGNNSTTGFRGLEYLDDYSANYTDRSLVDKAYVVSQFNPVNLGTYFYDNLAIKSTPSPDDEIVMLDSVTGEAVTATFSSFGGGGGSGTVTSVTGVSGETTVANGTTTPVIGIDPAYTTARDTYADGKIATTITDGVTTSAPNQNAVFDALALKANLASPTFTGTVTIPNGGLVISSGNSAQYLRADGVAMTFANSVRSSSSGTITPSNSVIVSNDTFATIANKTQGQINELIRMDGASGSFSATGTATTTFTVTIGATQANTTYKVNATPTNALSAAMFYVTNKTTTTFDVVFLTGLTGAVAFDWSIRP